MSVPEGLVEHLFAALEEQVSLESVQSALESFYTQGSADAEEEEKPKAKPKGGAKKVKEEEEKHTCETMINTRDGGPQVCAKNAKNQVGNMWHCGTEKSGHYKSALVAASKEKPAPVKAPAKQPAKVPATVK